MSGRNEDRPVKNDMFTIRDPIHGTMVLSDQERAVVDTAAVQRLRHVRQLGFAELAYPGATHSRYAHSLGAMHLAGVIAERIFASAPLTPQDRTFLIQHVRLAGLLHDVGHGPLSHASETLMPALSTLSLPTWVRNQHEQATHEDYSVHLLLHSQLGRVLDQHFGEGCGERIASIVAGHLPTSGSAFVLGNVDYYPLLRQIVSGELDCDRMDYLLRDSFYTGVNYGKYDHEWLCQYATHHVHEGRAYLALGNRAIFAFEDFLLSRYHMFLAVYYHYVPVGFDHLMSTYGEQNRDEYQFPSDPDEYATYDDIHLISALRRSPHKNAQRIAHRRGFRLLVETTERDQPIDKAKLLGALSEAGIEHFKTTSSGTLSKYEANNKETFAMFVVTESLRQVSKLADYTPLFGRYAESVKVQRVYVAPEQITDARQIMGRVLNIPGHKL